ncbi:MAG TPA: hypothetical protein VFG10_14480 [Saprospiraceae bacterium]|nr:hypothetical protein [Saprospiraceae bacterium]
MKLTSLYLLILLNANCYSQESLSGAWCLVPNCNSKLIFQKDGKFELAINDIIVSSLESEELNYYTERTNGENWIQVSNKSNQSFLRFNFEIDDCNLLVVFYKSGNIDHDIDEIGWYRKPGCNTELLKPAHIQTFIIPGYFQGEAFIIYAGDKIRNEKSKPFNLPPSGVQNLSFKAKPFDLLRGGLVFLTTEGDTIQQFLNGNEPTFKSNLNQQERFVKIIGFNQTSREDLESRIGINDKIRDVLLLNIGPLNELISKE